MSDRQSAMAGCYIAVDSLLRDGMIKDEDEDMCIKNNNRFYDRLDKEMKDHCDLIMTERNGEEIEEMFKL